MSFAGLDIEAVLNHARTLEVNAANELFNVLTRMNNIVPQLMNVWHGEDATRFQHQWEANRKQLTALHGTMQQVAQSVAGAAARQRDVSGG